MKKSAAGKQKKDIRWKNPSAWQTPLFWYPGAKIWKNRILVERFLGRMRKGEFYVDALKTFGTDEISEKQFDILMELAEKELSFEEKIRVLYDISRSMKFMGKSFHGVRYDQIEQLCFHTLQKEIFAQSVINQTRKYHIAKDEVKVSLPVRVNWGGGWTDTPPYCNEKWRCGPECSHSAPREKAH